MTTELNWLPKLVICSFLTLTSAPAIAQITPDGTLGAESSRFTPNVQIQGTQADSIDGGAQRGGNLFHSFSDFNVVDGQKVYFVNPNGVENILSRVTGGNVSNILGTLGVDGSANLFLLNPNGIIFGPNASLDVRGSFVGTTANAIGFGEQGFFSATDPSAPPLLTVNPSALLYTQINQGAIANQGALTAPPGQSLVLAGGNIDFNSGSMAAQGGRIELAAISGTGTVGLNADNSLSIPTDLPLADVALSNSEIGVTAGNNSGVAIHARNLDVSGSSQIYSQIGSDVTAVAPTAGDITLDTTGTIQIREGSLITNSVARGESGKGGNINVKTSSLSLTDGALLDTSTYGTGDAGSVLVQVKDSVSAAYSDISSIVGSGAVGNGGNINITAPTLSLTDGSQLLTSVRGASNNLPAGFGIAGNVFVDVSGDVTISGVKDGFRSGIFSTLGTGAKGKGGDISITGGSLSLSDGAQISTSTYGIGDAGSVLVQAKDSVSVADSDIRSNVEPGAVGNGGNINITAPTLSLTDGGVLVTLFNGASNNLPAGEGIAGNVFVDVSGSVTISGVKDDLRSGIFSALGPGVKGKGGNINITTGSLSLSDSALVQASTYGIGDAGSVLVQAKDSVSASNSAIISSVLSGAKGNGGNINIIAPTLSLTDGGTLGTLVLGASNNQPAGEGIAGNVNLNVSRDVTISGVKNEYTSAIYSTLGPGAKGKGGNINITTGSLSLIDDALLQASTDGIGDAGSVIIDARRVLVDGDDTNIYSTVATTGRGKGGDIRITTDLLSLSNGGLLSASTHGFGDAGSVLVQAKDSVSAAGNSDIRSNVESGAVGNGGNVNIIAPTLSLTDGGGLVTIVREASNNLPAGEGIAGNVFVDVSGSVTISGVNNESTSGIFSRLETGAKGKGGNVNLKTGSLLVTDGAQIDASTFGIGDAGNVEILATQPITVAGIGNDARSSAIFSTSGDNPAIPGTGRTIVGTGKSGNITITAPALKVSEGGVIDARTFNAQPGGDINLTLGTLQLLNGGQIFTTSESSGAAGTIAINANQGVTISGNDTTYFSRLNQFPNRIAQISPNSSISVRSSATGAAGNINLNTPRLVLDNQGTINAQSNAVDGGDITINSDLLLLRRNSSISATAGLTSGAGNGGNITIDADFIIAVPNENSDIIANAFSGRGGNIQIRTQGIFGIQPRSSLTDLSDITASSQQNVQGQIDITEPNVQPTQGLVELPGQILDASNQIAQSCPNGNTASRPLGEFTVTGRGSLPPNPIQPLVGTTSLSPLASIDGDTEANQSQQTSSKPTTTATPATIVEAQGWVQTQDGKIALVASAPQATPVATTVQANCQLAK